MVSLAISAGRDVGGGGGRSDRVTFARKGALVLAEYLKAGERKRNGVCTCVCVCDGGMFQMMHFYVSISWITQPSEQ